MLMAVESACIPIPSELIMPLAGWMLIKAKGLGIEWVVFAAFIGALGNTAGSVVTYYAGAWGGRAFVQRYGRYLLISHHDLDLADRFFTRWGAWAIFVARLLPVVRTFVSVPAGVSRMNVAKFTGFTFAGSFLWSLWLAAAGYGLGSNWEKIRNWMRPVDIPVAVICVLLVAWYIVRHIRRAWEEPQPSGPEA